MRYERCDYRKLVVLDKSVIKNLLEDAEEFVEDLAAVANPVDSESGQRSDSES